MALALWAALALNCAVLPETSLQQLHSLDTPWTSKVSRTKPHPEYPRPQMVRKNWTNLNGIWDVSTVGIDALNSDIHLPVIRSVSSDAGRAQSSQLQVGSSFATHASWDSPGASIGPKEKILVPFPYESKLSGIGKMVPENHGLRYERTFKSPLLKPGERALLHFGAVDWEALVYVNDKPVGRHDGGFDPFTIDITDALRGPGDQRLGVMVSDPTDAGPQPRGKQVRKPGGIFYTPTSGIWQTVWMEVVPASYIRRVKTTTKMSGLVTVQPHVVGPDVETWAEIWDGDRRIARGWAAAGADTTLELRVPEPKLWSPTSPYLYRLKVGAGKDVVDSYVGIREVSLMKNASGQPQIAVNGKITFLFGPLDQGFWPDGLFTPPTDAAMKYDIEVTKNLGFNMIRKHVKVEPDRWYYWADKMGMLVIQDMPSGDKSIGPSDPDIMRTPESKEIYERELKAMIDALHSHPSIVTWVPFNEGWGQFDTARITDWIKDYDPTRLVDSASGWTDRGTGDIIDIHPYPGPAAPKPETGRASLVGEFGGYGLIVEGHTWQKDGWGYQSFKTKEELTKAIEGNFFNLRLLRKSHGISGAVYTQTTDVETELNGLLTYDRAMIKPDTARLKRAIALVYREAPDLETVVPTSESSAVDWAYATEKPADGWMNVSFDDSAWKRGPGGFGTPSTPGSVVRTTWDSSDIWLRRTFSLGSATDADDLYLRIHHDDDVEVYLDGKLVLAKSGWTTGYVLLKWPGGNLSAGEHTLAVYCHQNRGGQYIDVGLVRVRE